MPHLSRLETYLSLFIVSIDMQNEDDSNTHWLICKRDRPVIIGECEKKRRAAEAHEKEKEEEMKILLEDPQLQTLYSEGNPDGSRNAPDLTAMILENVQQVKCIVLLSKNLQDKWYISLGLSGRPLIKSGPNLQSSE